MKKFLSGFLMADCMPMDVFLKPALLLGFRLYVAQVFFMSGLTKIKTWSSTLSLFEYEYNVPVIPFELAAYMATIAELVLPVALVVGLFSRPAALGLFILNVVAAISYPEISPAGINDHIIWGTMLAVVFAFGPGNVSIDKLLSNLWKKG
ncbi:MAG: DoxX family protein [Cocleimonas sp.]|nr:DoxX family protein [Cocleimonas sp.]